MDTSDIYLSQGCTDLNGTLTVKQNQSVLGRVSSNPPLAFSVSILFFPSLFQTPKCFSESALGKMVT